MRQIIMFLISGFVLVLILYAIYTFVGVPIGTFIDWLVGILAIMWLFLIVTVPWNAHFRAREIEDEARISKLKNIEIVEANLSFVKGVVRRSLWVAIGLHVISAIGLYWLAASGVSDVGYFAALLALLLTLLRPAVRMYEYIQTRLNSIRQEFRYPREDINLLLNDIAYLKQRVEVFNEMFTTEKDKPSWKNKINKFIEDVNITIEKLQHNIDTNKNEHKQELVGTEKELSNKILSLEKLHKSDMERIAVDSHILDSVRTLAAFLKEMKG